MSDHPILRTAEFDRTKLKTYWLWQPVVICSLSVVLIPIIPFVLIGVLMFVDKYINRLECALTTKSLEVKKGLLNRVESTVPLEKITDVQYFQGPIMRLLGIEGFRVETAGQSSGATGYLVNMLGIKDTRGFRQAVLAQRDRVNASADHDDGLPPRSADRPPAPAGEALDRIHDTLLRIEQALKDRA